MPTLFFWFLILCDHIIHDIGFKTLHKRRCDVYVIVIYLRLTEKYWQQRNISSRFSKQSESLQKKCFFFFFYIHGNVFNRFKSLTTFYCVTHHEDLITNLQLPNFFYFFVRFSE